ncbi:MAG: hypothetical protein A2046_05500 [Bacteroidetes bacterium GWA2_30_7]|nr:MAG: hypothetical protein A2046_05500 [Bacteroidetes bacterium GWA2_30_7]
MEGKEIINNKELDYNCLEIETLCKLFTLIIRNDRFNDGFLVHNLQNGTIFKIIKALEFKISNK